MIINNINELKFKKGEQFKNLFFKINHDNMYITDEFLKLLYDKEPKYRILSSKHSITVNGMYMLTICFIKHENGTNYKWLVAGSCGDYGFNGMERIKRNTYGVRTKRRVFNYLVKFYLNTNLCRIEKILKLKNNIK